MSAQPNAAKRPREEEPAYGERGAPTPRLDGQESQTHSVCSARLCCPLLALDRSFFDANKRVLVHENNAVGFFHGKSTSTPCHRAYNVDRAFVCTDCIISLNAGFVSLSPPRGLFHQPTRSPALQICFAHKVLATNLHHPTLVCARQNTTTLRW
jgi:hypothetical protein